MDYHMSPDNGPIPSGIRVSDVIFRYGQMSDDRELMSIINFYITQSTVTLKTKPLTIHAVRNWISEHDGHPYPLIVAETVAHGVIGYGTISAYSSYAGFRDTGEVSIYLRHGFTGLKIGTRLMETMLHEVKTKGGCRRLMAQIVDTNGPSIKLHKTFGFKLNSEKLLGSKFGKDIEVVTMVKMLNPFYDEGILISPTIPMINA